jgi:short subunit dehydrogenase-like uncharacterized protein|tara:strand:+ start:1111 stop:2172 length:1062 start_codon:yes stop_codon:yes gene_type:complete
MSGWMIYGANGYTGELTARRAKLQGMKPILAGRNEESIKALADELDLPFRCFSLEDNDLVECIKDVSVIVHSAGPFSKTAKPMMEACIKAKTHYLDITGEISVFEASQGLSHQAKEAEIVICPGVGFDVIPTDCVAAQLKLKMPDAIYLRMGFDSNGSFSRGTAKTSIEGIPQGCKIRKNGKLTTIALGALDRRIDFGNGEKLAVAIPWGDISTAFYSTLIPNIEVYMPTSATALKFMKLANYVRWLMGLNVVQKILKNKIDQGPKGPDENQRQKSPMHVWGEVENAAGKKIICRIKTNNGYEVTVNGSITCANHLLENYQGDFGTLTPSQLVGPNLVERLPDCGSFIFETST